MTVKRSPAMLAALLAVGVVTIPALAQTQSAPPTATPATPVEAPATPAAQAAPAAPVASPPAASAAAEPAPTKVAAVAKPHLSRCALAIHATERKLEKSSATPDNIAAAWHHLEEAKKSSGSACQAQAHEAADLL